MYRWGGSAILAGIPLFYYFLRVQIDNSISHKIIDSKTMYSVFKSIVTGYKNCFVTFFLFGSPKDMEVHKVLISLCILVGLIVCIFSIIKYKSQNAIIIFAMVVASLIIYTIACESGYYGTNYTKGYGRWGIMFVPLIYMLIAYSFFRLKQENRNKIVGYRISIIAVAVYFFLNIYGITVNWNKSDCREYTQCLANSINNDHKNSCIIVEQSEATNTLYYLSKYDELYHTDIYVCLDDNQIAGVYDDNTQSIESIIDNYSSIYLIYLKEGEILSSAQNTISKVATYTDSFNSSTTAIDKYEKTAN